MKKQLQSTVSALGLSALILLGALGATAATAASAGNAQAATCVPSPTISCPADGGTGNG